jgi:type IV pilus assembly protein PilV
MRDLSVLPPIAIVRQSGSFLLEALIAILIFSMGILAIVGLQAASIAASSDAKYRTEASLLANQLIGEMWASDHTQLVANYQGASGSGGAGYAAWLPKVNALPGATTYAPTVAVNGVSQQVLITVFWKQPSENPATPPHNYVATATIQ